MADSDGGWGSYHSSRHFETYLHTMELKLTGYVTIILPLLYKPKPGEILLEFFSEILKPAILSAAMDMTSLLYVDDGVLIWYVLKKRLLAIYQLDISGGFISKFTGVGKQPPCKDVLQK